MDHSQLSDIKAMFHDIQPNTNGQVINIIHPSLYPIVSGITKRKDGSEILLTDSDFQWLPAEFYVAEDIEIKTYINNLYMGDIQSYSTISKVFKEFIPLFNEVLSENHQVCHDLNDEDFHEWDSDGYKYYITPCPKYDYNNTDSNYDHNYDMAMEEWKDNVSFYSVEPEPFESYETVNLYNKSLQVIVKMSNIYLTPEKPTWESGKWHIEGTTNENIIAFPNNLQHKLDSFSLDDPTKPGHRKIIAFFLVDPENRIISSKDVSYQQEEFIIRDLHLLPNKLNPDIHHDILKYSNCMSIDKAIQHRDLLIEERKVVLSEEDPYFENEYSLCEH
ncbi:hypothetical protein CONCODRAFT_68445 [Conidiobolus coronatus NRRL 28638]|uniref:DUF4246 domain-containing protein n=1 Tax=Conidiobolus coronatus (strain ATCC 28846 / CBS 209.66 / NRRL 28638) TaxID=796925 RepID=A0A137PDU2_CONC2|nr:hypothetical protein CONCODRAFT_68445 [Conidiobolus coronatus NRRL 28638]|eukprot:KXN73168.1 hypothetical protein CONCODRAFT_68445 [Conidiobolus coronatus NRRL 28638]